MATLENRLTALEQIHQKTHPALILFYQPEQNGEPTPAQKLQIEEAEKQGREVRIINYVIVTKNASH